jgi:hypothetical protein
MHINSTIVAVLAFLFLSPAVAGSADTPKGFRHLAWGASADKHLKKAPTVPAGGITVYQPRPGKSLLPLFDVPVAEEAYSFSKGKFFSASAWLDGDENFRRIKAALIGAYGQAAVARERKKLWIWRWPESPVEVRLAYNDEFSRATVTYANPAMRASEATGMAAVSNATK